MAKKKIAMLAVALLATAGAVTLASHMQDPPPIGETGENAYVRNFPADSLDGLEDGEDADVHALYTSYTLAHFNDEEDRVEEFTSRGRLADAEVFRIETPNGTFEEANFSAVQDYERGIIVTEGDGGCLFSLNGVNAGVGFLAKGEQELRFLSSGKYDVKQVSDDRAELDRDGHTYAIEVVNGSGSVEVDGVNVRVNLSDGSQVRGWITDEYPATTEVMNYEFDHLAQQDCVPEEAEEDAEDDEEEPEDQPSQGASDVGVNKTAEFHNESKTAEFTITVDSHGNKNATNVTLSDDLPEADGADSNDSSWNLSGPDAEACEQSGEDGRNVTCDFGTLTPDEARTVVAKANHSGCSSLDNTAEVSADEDTHPQDNEDNASIPARDCPEEPEEEPAEGAPDVAVSKNGDWANEWAIFDITVDSHGNANATNVTLTDSLPKADGASTDDTQWYVGGPDADACTQSGEDGRELTCEFGTMPPNTSAVIDVRAYNSECNALENVANVSADEDTHPSDNSDDAVAVGDDCPDEEEEEPAAEPDVGVNKTGDWQNEWAIYTITVDSHGDANASNVTLRDELPAADGASTDDTQWYVGGPDADACEQSGEDGRNLTCDFGELSPNETRTIDVRAYNSECNALNNTAYVTADNDSHSEDNSDDAVAVGDNCSSGSTYAAGFAPMTSQTALTLVAAATLGSLLVAAAWRVSKRR